MTSAPSVSVLVLNRNGREHLKACLSSLLALEYPAERLAIQVIDNASTDDSIALVREHFPNVDVLPLEANLGFAEAYNVAVGRASSEFVAILNNDTRVDRRWLAELTSAADRHSATAVASKILDWTGDRIDFVGGIVSFVGHAWQIDFREPATRTYGEDELLFACGASALYNRSAFLEAGGFDSDFFAYFEDVDLGWRLNLMGHKTVLAPRALTYHRLHGSWAHLALAQRLRLFERNALAMIYKNYEAATLERVLPAAVALSLARGLIDSGIEALPLDFSSKLPPDAIIQQRLAASLIALEDFVAQLPALARKRQGIQAKRRRSDADLAPLFRDPFRLHVTGTRYEEIARALIRDFGIEDIFRPAGFTLSPHTATQFPRPREVDARAAPAGPSPKVSVIVLTAIGTAHLQECLTSLRGQNFPLGDCEVIVVDNGSPSPVTQEVEQWYPGVKVVRNETNLGFASGNNVGARAASGQYLVFLNDDTRVDPDWLRELLSTARRRNAAAVAACMLDWEGRRLDFAGGTVNFEGKGFQPHYGVERSSANLEEVRLLFPCGGAMLMDRAAFMHAGGWDDGAFAYYEDVELGWRMNLLGYEVWLSPRAVVYHKHHGTSGQWAEAPRIRLYERNSLRMLYPLLETRSLVRVLPAALLLAADRALLLTDLSRASSGVIVPRRGDRMRVVARAGKAALRSRGVNRQMSVPGMLRRLGVRGIAGVARDVLRAISQRSEIPRNLYLIERASVSAAHNARVERLPLPAAAVLSGILGFLDDLSMLSARREDLQSRRRLGDAELLKMFGRDWTMPCGSAHNTEHHASQRLLVEQLAIAELVTSPAADAARITRARHAAVQ